MLLHICGLNCMLLSSLLLTQAIKYVQSFSNSYRARERDSFTLYVGRTLPDSPPAALSPKIQSRIWQEKQIPAEGKRASRGFATVLGKPLKTEPNRRTIWKPLNTATSRARAYTVQLVAVCPAQTHITLVMLQGCQRNLFQYLPSPLPAKQAIPAKVHPHSLPLWLN